MFWNAAVQKPFIEILISGNEEIINVAVNELLKETTQELLFVLATFLAGDTAARMNVSTRDNPAVEGRIEGSLRDGCAFSPTETAHLRAKDHEPRDGRVRDSLSDHRGEFLAPFLFKLLGTFSRAKIKPTLLPELPP